MKVRRDFLSQSALRQDLQKFYERPVARVSFELVVSILTVMLFAVFALRPTLLTMSELLKEIEEKKQLDKDLSSKIAALSTAQSELITYAPQIAALDQAVFRETSAETVAYYLEYITQQEGVEVKSIALADIPILLSPTSGQHTRYQLVRYPTQITLRGSFSSIRAFLERVEQYQPLFSVDGLTLKTAKEEERGGETGPQLVEASIRLGVYMYQPPGVSSPTGGGSTRPSSQIENTLGEEEL